MAALDKAFDGTVDPARPEAPLSAPRRQAKVPTAPAAATQAPAAPAGEPTTGADGRKRGPDGKFLPAEPAVAGAPIAATPAVAAAPPPDAAVEKEISDLKLSPPAALRFRALASENKALEPLKELHTTLEKAGIADPKQLPQVIERASRATSWENVLREKTVRPQQMNEFLDVVQRLNTGDPTQMRQAYDYLQGQLDGIGRALGMRTANHDPLGEHPDLQRAVDAEQITPEYALELAQQRATTALVTHNQQQQQNQTRATADHTENVRRGRESLDVLERQLTENDPEYPAKQAALYKIAKVITRNAHPSRWAQEVLDAYRALPAPGAVSAPAAPAQQQNGNVALPPVGAVPMRPTGGMRNVKPAPKSAMEALNFGLETLSHG